MPIQITPVVVKNAYGVPDIQPLIGQLSLSWNYLQNQKYAVAQGLEKSSIATVSPVIPHHLSRVGGWELANKILSDRYHEDIRIPLPEDLKTNEDLQAIYYDVPRHQIKPEEFLTELSDILNQESIKTGSEFHEWWRNCSPYFKYDTVCRASTSLKIASREILQVKMIICAHEYGPIESWYEADRDTGYDDSGIYQRCSKCGFVLDLDSDLPWIIADQADQS